MHQKVIDKLSGMHYYDPDKKNESGARESIGKREVVDT
jgi:hypothetical protein